jgi:membrane protease YdiL (CAAX protease family)
MLLSDWPLQQLPSLGAQILLQALYLGLAGFIVWVVVTKERQSLRSIGLRPPTLATLLWGALLWVAGFYVLPLMTTPLVGALGSEGLEPGLTRLASLPVWFRIVLAVTGGAVEETLYRGYAIERLSTLTGKRWLAASISAIAFGLSHIPAWGLGFSLGAALPGGIVMTLFYLWRRDLLANILAHSTGLVIAMLTVVQ